MLSKWLSLLSFFVLVGARRRICSSCDKGFNARSTLATCAICGVERHLRCVGAPQFLCDTCGFSGLPHYVDSAMDIQGGDQRERTEREDQGENEEENGRHGEEIEREDDLGENLRNEGGIHERGDGEEPENVGENVGVPEFKKGISFIGINARSLLPKMSEVRRVLERSSASIMAVSETWLDENIRDDEVDVQGYSIIRRDRDRHGGGTLLYVKDSIAFNRRKDLELEGTESVWAEILLPKTRGIFVSSIYRPPNDGRFLEKFEATLEKVDAEKEVYILGDINIDFLKKDSTLCRAYTNVLSAFNLKQLINIPTRITDTTATILDHIITNSSGKLYNFGVLDCSISDHLPIYCHRLQVRGESHVPIVKWVRSFKGYSAEILNRELRLVDWSGVYLGRNVDEAYESFVSILRGLIDRLAPMRQLRTRQRTGPWMSGIILAGIRRRDDLFRQFKRDRSNLVLYGEFCRVRNQVQRDVKQAKQDYFRGIVERCDGDNRKLWSSLKGAGFNSKAKSGAKIVVNIDGEKCFDMGKVADGFNRFYANVARLLVDLLPRPLREFSPGSFIFCRFYREKGVRRDSFELTPVSGRFVMDQLVGLKAGKSTGLDDIAVRFLRDGAVLLADPLCHVINLSITSEVVPSMMKDARVTPVFKKGSRLECGNYRPVSILNVLSKVLERAVHGQLVAYLTKRGVLAESQSGFRPGFSTDTCLLGLTDFIRKEVSKGKLVGLVLLDLQKAFDTVDHGVLLQKLGFMGVRSVSWFRSYLSGRRQCVLVDGVISGFLDVSCGVPQGSILGPILFLCYVNDMAVSLGCRLSLYADDSTLVASGVNAGELGEYLSGQLASCKRWLVDNRLSLHLGKTECILIGSRRKLRDAGDFRVTCDGSDVKRVDKVRYLGVMLDQHLDGQAQALGVIKKVASRLGFLYRSAAFLDLQTRRVLCNALVQPCLDYCIASWYLNLTVKMKDRLDVIQRKMARFVLGVGPRAHIGLSTLRDLGWLTVKDRVRYFSLLHVFRVKRGSGPPYLRKGFVAVTDVHDHKTRASCTGFHISGDDVVGSFSFFGKKEWNGIPDALKTVKNIDVFKKSLKAFLLESYG